MADSKKAFLNQSSIQSLDSKFPDVKTWFYIIAKITVASWRVTLFLVDVTKDLVLWGLLYVKSGELEHSDPEHCLLWIFFSLIFLAQSLVGLYITYNFETIFSLPANMSTCKKVFILISMILLTPCLPSLIIFKATVYFTDMAYIVTDARDNPSSQPSKVLHQINAIKTKHRIHLQIYAYARIIEAKVETLPQLLVLISFLTRWTADGLGSALLNQRNLSSTTSILFMISLPYSVIMIVSAIIGFINTQKRGSLGLVSSSILGISYIFQLMSSMVCWLFVFASIVNGSSLFGNMLLLLIALLITWIFTYVWSYIIVDTFTNFPIFERLLHVLVNTFITIPFRNVEDEIQRRKSTEIFWHLVFRCFANLAMTTISVYFIRGPLDKFMLNIFLLSILPICCCQLLGGFFMWLFYKKHPWNQVNSTSCNFCCFPTTPCEFSPAGLCKILGCFFVGFIQIVFSCIFCCCCDIWFVWCRCFGLHRFQWRGWGNKTFEAPKVPIVAQDELVVVI